MNWRDRPRTLSRRHSGIGDESGLRTVFHLDDREVHVELPAGSMIGAEGLTATVQSSSSRSGMSVLENAFVSEGELRIHLEDLLYIILEKVSPDELALELLKHEASVREAFVECVSNRHSGTFDEAQRRRLLAGLGGEVHEMALDRAVDLLVKLEDSAANKAWEHRRFATFETWWQGVQESISSMPPIDLDSGEPGEGGERQTFDVGEVVLERIRQRNGLEPFKSIPDIERNEHRSVVGPLWREAREHWRGVLESRFPSPRKEVFQVGDRVRRQDSMRSHWPSWLGDWGILDGSIWSGFVAAVETRWTPGGLVTELTVCNQWPPRSTGEFTDGFLPEYLQHHDPEEIL